MTRDRNTPRTALVHDWLVSLGGAEVVLRELRRLYPDADIFCVIDGLSDADRERIGVGCPTTTWLQRVPLVHRLYRGLLPLMPAAIEALDLSGYELVISSSHAVAKGVRAPRNALHVCYCHSPMRYAWDMQDTYLGEAGLRGGPRRWLVTYLLSRLRAWDRRSASRVQAFVANSAFVGARIARAYDRTSTVVHPPVDTDFFTVDPTASRGTHYITASRLVGYKRVHAIVEAFRDLPDHQLVVVGDGPERERVLAAAGPNVTWRGRLDDHALRDELRRARAFLFAAEEDFGILPVEAQACGTPVIAFGRGGALETVTAETGAFFAEASPQAIAQAVRTFEQGTVPSVAACRANAERFSTERFHQDFRGLVESLWAAHLSRATPPPP
jgi:glycosyltransferase involved in cell wall biosynthesis